MVISIGHENICCDTRETFEKELSLRMASASAEIWVSENGTREETPCIAVLLENDMAMLTYFNNDGESYVSVGDEKRDDGNVAFSAGQYEVWNYQIIKKDEALAGLMDFFQCKELPQSIKWERVC